MKSQVNKLIALSIIATVFSGEALAEPGVTPTILHQLNGEKMVILKKGEEVIARMPYGEWLQQGQPIPRDLPNPLPKQAGRAIVGNLGVVAVATVLTAGALALYRHMKQRTSCAETASDATQKGLGPTTQCQGNLPSTYLGVLSKAPASIAIGSPQNSLNATSAQ